VPFIGVEAAAASAVTFLASAIVSSYLMDWAGLTIAPIAVLIVSIAAAAATFAYLRRRAAADRGAFVTFLAIVCGAFAWLLWLARPEFLPTGSGPDLVHHVALVEYIERHWRLVHDVRLSEYLGEMVDYTPGFHLLAALVSVWLPGDALHVIYAVVAWTVALKAGIVFLIARRLVPPGAPRDPFALAAVLLLLAPRVYSIGSFTEQSYLAQVVAELFAIAMFWAIVVWREGRSAAAMVLFGAFGAAGFLVWPVWSGPLLLVLAATALVDRSRPVADRFRAIAPAFLAIGTAAVVHAARHVGGVRMAGTGGFAIRPTPDVVGWPFFALSAAALVVTAIGSRTRVLAALVAAIAVQAAALALAARASGAAAPYLAIKMFYLAIYPLAIAIAVALADGWRAMGARVPQLRSAVGAWAIVAVIGILAARPVIAAPRPKPIISEPVLQAAAFARREARPACIDYLTHDGYTAYWLHLAVFGNPRASGRATDEATFEPKQALVRWILPGGLPYAITDDFEALPRDVRDGVDVLARFGRAAVIKRRGESACP
jgi:hypothetical protein